ncbi:MAG: methylated-DNA--[protein]-cysteine S-methyltransferase [Gallionella sp.]
MDYQAKFSAPFGVLGINCTDDALTGISFLAPGSNQQSFQNPFSKKVCDQLTSYFNDPDFRFSLPINLVGTAHQKAVWQELQTIPRGQVTTYGALAAKINSGAQAVGQACGANPVPIFIPCHRVAAKNGLGGFMGKSSGASLDFKKWLIEHEQR